MVRNGSNGRGANGKGDQLPVLPPQKRTKKAKRRPKGRSPRAQTSATALQAAMRRAQALQMRLAGATLQEIADQLKIKSKRTIWQYVWDALDDAAEQEAGAAEKVRLIELRRLDRLLMSVWPLALGGRRKVHREVRGADGSVSLVENEEVVPPDLQAHDRVIRIMQRRARLLGIDAPQEFGFPPGGVPVHDAGAGPNVEEMAALADDPKEWTRRYHERLKARYGERIPDVLGNGARRPKR
jgi:hypothetical protein